MAEYSTATLGSMAFAFDGTVTGIAPSRTNRAGRGIYPLVSATFHVQQWFRGGGDEVVSVDIDPPASMSEDGPPSYGVGTRLLVSGQHRWGEASLNDAIAWGCGFTRYFDPATADTWDEALA